VALADTVGATPNIPAASDVVDTIAVTATPPSASVTCTDIRTGFPFAFRAHRVLLNGVLDPAWNRDSSQICRGVIEGLRQVSVSDGVGGTFMGWTDGRGDEPDISLHHVSANGAPVAGWPVGGLRVAELPHSQYHLDLAPDGEGGVYLAWEDYRDARAGDIYALRVTSAGNVAPGWPSGGLLVCGAAGEQSMPRVAWTGADGAWIAWQDRRTGVLEVYVEKLTGGGSLASNWPEGGTKLVVAAAPAMAPIVATDSAGSAVIVWRHGRADRLENLMALPISALTPSGGSALVPLVLASGASQLGEVSVQPLGSSGVLVSWPEVRNESRSLRAQRLSLIGAGQQAWTEGGVSVAMGPLGLNAPVVIGDGARGALVAWEDFRDGDRTNIYLQRVAADGSIAPGWPVNGLGVGIAANDQYAPHVARDGAGGAIVTWADAAESAGTAVMHAHPLLTGPPPKLLSAQVWPGHVRVVWSVSQAGVGTLDAQRRVTEGDWQGLPGIAPNDSLKLVLDDRSVTDGAHVEYRLGFRSGDDQMFFTPVALDVPVAPVVLTLRSAWARASEHMIQVSFALPRGQAPLVDLIDVTGRRVENRRYEGLEPGEQVVRFRVPSALASGVYFLRLVQGGQARVAKVVYLR
jgi:hypothetical protein